MATPEPDRSSGPTFRYGTTDYRPPTSLSDALTDVLPVNGEEGGIRTRTSIKTHAPKACASAVPPLPHGKAMYTTIVPRRLGQIDVNKINIYADEPVSRRSKVHGCETCALKDLRQEQLGAVFLGVCEEVFRCSLFDHFTFVEEQEAVSHLAGETHFMRHDEHRHS